MNTNPLSGLPMGFSMALAQNEKALNCFSNMSEQQKKDVIDKTHSIQSKKEMKMFVNNLGNNNL